MPVTSYHILDRHFVVIGLVQDILRLIIGQMAVFSDNSLSLASEKLIKIKLTISEVT